MPYSNTCADKNSDNRDRVRALLKESPVVLAPMAGITDRTFRQLAIEQGAGLTCTEMISAKALSYGNDKTRALLDIDGAQGQTAVQFFGSEPEIMAAAAVEAQRRGAAYVDVNMGCPVPKVVKNGEGSALLENPALAARIVAAMKAAVDIPVAVKIRLGTDRKHLVTPDFAVRMEEAGASLITVHGRTRDQYYSGEADREQIRLIREAVKAPLIGNGDIRKPEDARRMMEETGCDAVMVGRAALGNPWVVGWITRYILDREDGREPSAEEKIGMALEHFRRLVALKGEKKAVPEMRKHLAWYLKGLPGTAPLKQKLFQCTGYAAAEELLLSYLRTVTQRLTTRQIDRRRY